MSCQIAANKSCNIFHIDLKRAFLQGQSHNVNRDVVCQLPPEAGHPPHIAAKTVKNAYGMNDATRRWWNILDKALCSYGILRKVFQVGSEDWKDVTITGQRIRWMKDPQLGSCNEVCQQKAFDKLEEIPVERNAKEDLRCTPAMHTRYRSHLGQINCLQSRTQLQCCYKFCRSVSKAASPTIGDVKALNHLARTTQVTASETSVLAT